MQTTSLKQKKLAGGSPPGHRAGPSRPSRESASRQSARALTWAELEELAGTLPGAIEVKAGHATRNRKRPIVFSSHVLI